MAAACRLPHLVRRAARSAAESAAADVGAAPPHSREIGLAVGHARYVLPQAYLQA